MAAGMLPAMAGFESKAAASEKPAGHAEAAPPACIHVFSKPFEHLSYNDASALIAEGGYGGIDLTVRSGGHVAPEKVGEELPRAVEAAGRNGLRVDMITTSIVDPDAPGTSRILQTASALGVRYYRLGVFRYDDDLGVWGSLQKLEPVFRRFADLNEAHGLHGAVQNHSGARVSSPVWDLFELFRDLDPQWIGCQYDIRHATVEGARSWPLALNLLAPWIRCTVIKDFTWQMDDGQAVPVNVPLGEGLVSFDDYFRIVRDLNVTGPISVHFPYGPFTTAARFPSDSERKQAMLSALEKDLRTLKAWLDEHELA
ncbi:MAG: sugar phosphate isomerase/epimerase family protein [Opitutaceae bacterium]